MGRNLFISTNEFMDGRHFLKTWYKHFKNKCKKDQGGDSNVVLKMIDLFSFSMYYMYWPGVFLAATFIQ